VPNRTSFATEPEKMPADGRQRLNIRPGFDTYLMKSLMTRLPPAEGG
jgi:hypothetical protein